MTARPFRQGRTAIAFAAIAVAVLSLSPIIYLFATGISWSDLRHEFGYPSTSAAVWQTVQLMTAISVISVVIGLLSAFVVTRTNVVYPRTLTVLLTIPLAVPGFVSAYAAFSAELVFAPQLGWASTFWGASIILALTLYPYVFLPCVVALRHVDPALEEVVDSLQPGRLSRFRHVTFPALRPALGAGVLIIALHVLAEYGAMVQLGRSTVTTKVMAEMLDYGDYQAARSLSLVLTGLSILVLVVTWMLSPAATAHHISRGAARAPERRPLGRWRIPATVGALIVPLIAVGPTVLMTTRGFTNPRRSVVIDSGHVTSALTTTLGYALAAAVVATIVGFPVSWWVSRHPSARSHLTERAVWLAHAMPSAVLALSLVYLATRVAPSLYKTPAVLIASYVILFLPLAVGYQRVGLGASRQTYDDVAASLGSGSMSTFTRVTLPLALPGFIAGATLVGLDASKELTTTLMLIPFNTQTLSTRLWATTNGESLDFTAAAPYAAMLVVLGVVPVAVLARSTLRQVSARSR